MRLLTLQITRSLPPRSLPLIETWLRVWHQQNIIRDVWKVIEFPKFVLPKVFFIWIWVALQYMFMVSGKY